MRKEKTNTSIVEEFVTLSVILPLDTKRPQWGKWSWSTPFTRIVRRRLSVGPTTMSRQGIGGSQRVPAWPPVFCLSTLPGNARNVRDFFRFISLALLHRYALSYPCKFRKWSFLSSSYVSIIRNDISRNLQRFCCSRNVLLPRARLPDAISHSPRKIARRKVRSDRLEYGLRAGTTRADLACVRVATLILACKYAGSRETSPETINW